MYKRFMIVLIMVFFTITSVFSASINSLSPAQLQMIKQAGYGNYLKKLKADAKKSREDVEKRQVVKNDINVKVKHINAPISTFRDAKTYKKVKLEKYGSSFFKNKNSLNPYSIPTPSNYVLTRGDKIAITVYGIDNGNFETKVNRNGAIIIDRVGIVKVAGLKYDEVKKLIKQRIRKAFPTSTDIVVNISEFTPIQVMVSGLVKAPGLYNLTSFSTIKDALLQTGGILENGSYRDILLKRGGKVIKHFDLYQLIRYGDDSSDLLLQNGDIIVVTSVKKSIKLYGAVNIPAIYELKDNENFISLIKYASGLKPNGDQHNVRLKRFINNKEIKVSSISLVTLYKMLPKDGDEVTVFEISPQMAKSVTLEGNVAVNGEVELPRDHRLSTLFKKQFYKFGKKGFFKFNTDFSFALVIYSDHIKSFNLDSVIKGYEDVKLYGGEKIHIFKRNEVKPVEYVYALGDIVNPNKKKYKFINGMRIRDLFYLVDFQRVTDNKIYTPATKVTVLRAEHSKKKTYTVDIRTNPNFKLKPFDEVRFYDIDQVVNENSVYISGEVFIPGKYSIKSDLTTINNIIKLAGGLTKKALYDNCEIARYKIEGDERVREIFNINLKDALKQHFKIYPDDEIKIFSISNWRKKMYVTLKGEVRYPGRYAIAVGEKLASVIKRAGGFTKNAFVEGAVFTRKSVKKSQEKQIKESLAKLKNRALALQSKGSEVGEDESAKERMLLSIKELENKANEIKPIGRVSINLYLDMDRFENSPYNITLKDGDSLTIPAMIDTVGVIGEVLNQNTFIYDPKLSVDDYLEKAGGLNQSADDDHIYIVKANGEAYRYKRNFFSTNQEIFKGDTIVVPLKLDAISDLKFAKDVSDILYKLAVTAASLKTVGAI